MIHVLSLIVVKILKAVIKAIIKAVVKIISIMMILQENYHFYVV